MPNFVNLEQKYCKICQKQKLPALPKNTKVSHLFSQKLPKFEIFLYKEYIELGVIWDIDEKYYRIYSISYWRSNLQ